MRVLLVEDEENTALAIEAMLVREGAVCDVTNSGEEALEIKAIYDYDIIILDLKLPDIDGHEILRKMRNEIGSRTPVLILSGLQDVNNKIDAISSGADDYLTKPFHQKELVARIKAIIRRTKGHSSSVVEIGEIRLNLDSCDVEAAGESLCLTSKEYKIVEFLMLKNGAAISKDMLLNRLYNGLDEPEAKIIDVFICKIRKKFRNVIGEIGEEYIRTVWGRGYKFVNPGTSDFAEDISANNMQQLDNVKGDVGM